MTTNLVAGGFAIVNPRSPMNAGRLVELVQYKGAAMIGNHGLKQIWQIKPVSGQPLFTNKMSDPPPEMFLVPADWLCHVTIDDPELELFLSVWAEDERTMRTE